MITNLAHASDEPTEPRGTPLNIQKIVKQAQQAKARMEAIQAELGNDIVEASAGGGMVKVQMTGEQELKSIKIDPAAVDPAEVEMLEDMILAAVNEANRMSTELAQQKMAEVTGSLQGMGFPGM